MIMTIQENAGMMETGSVLGMMQSNVGETPFSDFLMRADMVQIVSQAKPDSVLQKMNAGEQQDTLEQITDLKAKIVSDIQLPDNKTQTVKTGKSQKKDSNFNSGETIGLVFPPGMFSELLQTDGNTCPVNEQLDIVSGLEIPEYSLNAQMVHNDRNSDIDLNLENAAFMQPEMAQKAMASDYAQEFFVDNQDIVQYENPSLANSISGEKQEIQSIMISNVGEVLDTYPSKAALSQDVTTDIVKEYEPYDDQRQSISGTENKEGAQVVSIENPSGDFRKIIAVKLSGKNNSEETIEKATVQKNTEIAFSDNLTRLADNGIPDSNEENTINTSKPTFEQVAENVMSAIKEKNTSFELKLYPEGLGKVDVKLVCENKTVSISIQTHSKETETLLCSHINDLKSTLEKNDYEVSQVQINLANEGKSESGNYFMSGHYASDSNSRQEQYATTVQSGTPKEPDVSMPYNLDRLYLGGMNYTI